MHHYNLAISCPLLLCSAPVLGNVNWLDFLLSGTWLFEETPGNKTQGRSREATCKMLLFVFGNFM